MITKKHDPYYSMRCMRYVLISFRNEIVYSSKTGYKSALLKILGNLKTKIILFKTKRTALRRYSKLLFYFITMIICYLRCVRSKFNNKILHFK